MQQYLNYRTYHGCAMSAHHQHASMLAWRDEAHVVENRRLYREKFTAVGDIPSPHYDLRQPQGGFYHWLRTPIDDLSFSQRLFARTERHGDARKLLGRDTPALDLPGGNPGQGHIRVAWVAAKEDCLIARGVSQILRLA